LFSSHIKYPIFIYILILLFIFILIKRLDEWQTEGTRKANTTFVLSQKKASGITKIIASVALAIIHFVQALHLYSQYNSAYIRLL